MSEGERLDLGRSAILGEAVESLVGAVYLDGVGRGANLRDARHVLARFDLFLKDLR
jgi:dsRNA-specific ribonuclease